MITAISVIYHCLWRPPTALWEHVHGWRGMNEATHHLCWTRFTGKFFLVLKVKNQSNEFILQTKFYSKQGEKNKGEARH